MESGCVYGYRKIHRDLRDIGQQCGVNRVWRLMKCAGIKAQVGYRSPRARKGEASIVTPSRIQRQSFLKSHGMEESMSRRGNCHDNAVAEIFSSY